MPYIKWLTWTFPHQLNTWLEVSPNSSKSISTSKNAGVFAGSCNNVYGHFSWTAGCNYNSVVLGGCCNNIGTGADNSAIVASYGNSIFSPSSFIAGGNNNYISGGLSGISILGSNISGLQSNTVYVNNVCAINGAYYGNASGLTGYLNTVITVATPTSLAICHHNAILRWTSTASGVLAIPSGLTSYPIGGQTMLAQIGTGQAVISGCAGVTVLSASSKCKTSSTNSIVSIIKTSDNEYLLGGDLV